MGRVVRVLGSALVALCWGALVLVWPMAASVVADEPDPPVVSESPSPEPSPESPSEAPESPESPSESPSPEPSPEPPPSSESPAVGEPVTVVLDDEGKAFVLLVSSLVVLSLGVLIVGSFR